MTTIIFYRTGTRYKGFKARGHAEYADIGSDIVCSAISALIQGTLIGFDIADIKTRAGKNMRVSVSPKGRRKREAAGLLMETLYRSLCEIESQYPENVKVILRTKGGKKHVHDEFAAFRS